MNVLIFKEELMKNRDQNVQAAHCRKLTGVRFLVFLQKPVCSVKLRDGEWDQIYFASFDNKVNTTCKTHRVPTQL